MEKTKILAWVLSPVWMMVTLSACQGETPIPTRMEISDCATRQASVATLTGEFAVFGDERFAIVEAPPAYSPTYGLVDEDGETVLPATYAGIAQQAVDGLLVVACNWNNDAYDHGFIDRAGREVIPARFSAAKLPVEGLSAVTVRRGDGESRSGYYSLEGQFAIPPIYLQARSFVDGLAIVKTDEGWTVIDVKNQRQFTPIKAENMQRADHIFVKDPSELPVFYQVHIKNPSESERLRYLYGLVSADGNMVIPMQYRGVLVGLDHLSARIDAPNSPNGYLMGLYDFDGVELVPPAYDSAYPFNRSGADALEQRYGASLFVVERDGKVRLVAAGDVPVTDWFEDAGAFNEAFSNDEITFLE